MGELRVRDEALLAESGAMPLFRFSAYDDGLADIVVTFYIGGSRVDVVGIATSIVGIL